MQQWTDTSASRVRTGALVCSGAAALFYAQQRLAHIRRRKLLRAAQSSVVILGLGNCGGAIGRHLCQQSASDSTGFRVVGCSRSQPTAADVAAGIESIVLGGSDERTAGKAVDLLASELQGAKVIIATAPPGTDKGDPFLAEPKLLAAISAAAESGTLVIYLSSVGVYGDQGGSPVDEKTPPAPKTARAKRRFAAEESWRQLHVSRLAIVRLPGIYNPFRGPLEKAREGNERIVKEGHVFSRIHVDDIVQLCETLINATFCVEAPAKLWGEGPVEVINCCDSDPSPQHEVSGFAYELLGKRVPPAIPFETAELSAMARSFYDESRLMTNQKLRDLVGSLKYDSYKSGLRACLKQEQEIRAAEAAAESRGILNAAHAMLRASRAAVASAGKQLMPHTQSPLLRVALIDNGSLKAEATLSLRRLSAELQTAARSAGKHVLVEAVSARFADRIPARDLNDVPAQILSGWLERLGKEGCLDKIVLLPLLIGPSNTVTQMMPAAARAVAGLDVEISPSLVCQCPALYSASASGAYEIADVLLDRLADLDVPPPGASRVDSGEPLYTDASHHVFLCDHGSPIARVAEAREAVRKCLQEKLRQPVTGICMERREGSQFDFNGDLLQDVLLTLPSEARVSVALLFLQEGKHAGPGGDIVCIIADILKKRPDLKISTTKVMAGHTGLVDLLVQRLDKSIPLRLFE